MQLGYMRVSKADGSQVLDLQRDALLAAGVQPQHLYEDLASGRRDDRPGLLGLPQGLAAGGYAGHLDPGSAGTRPPASRQYRARPDGPGDWAEGAHRPGAALDTTTAAGKLVFGIFAALAEFERELIVERTNAGMAAARARGRGRCALQDDPGETPAGDGGDGPARDQGRCFVQNWASRVRPSTGMSTPRASCVRTATNCSARAADVAEGPRHQPCCRPHGTRSLPRGVASRAYPRLSGLGGSAP